MDPQRTPAGASEPRLASASRQQDPSQGYLRVAQAVVGDIGRVGKSGADALLPGGGPDASRTTRAAFLEHVRQAWPYPEERQAIFARMVPSIPNPVPVKVDGSDAIIPARNGLAAWEAMVKDAFPLGWPEPAPMLAPMGPLGSPMGATVGGMVGPPAPPNPTPASGGSQPGGFSPAPLAGEQMLGGAA